jgi:hypothetical protein
MTPVAGRRSDASRNLEVGGRAGLADAMLGATSGAPSPRRPPRTARSGGHRARTAPRDHGGSGTQRPERSRRAAGPVTPDHEGTFEFTGRDPRRQRRTNPGSFARSLPARSGQGGRSSPPPGPARAPTRHVHADLVIASDAKRRVRPVRRQGRRYGRACRPRVAAPSSCRRGRGFPRAVRRRGRQRADRRWRGGRTAWLAAARAARR